MEREVGELLEEVQRQFPDETQLHDFDRAYFSEKLRQRKWDFDTREVRPYFGYACVRQGVLDTAGRLFGVAFERADVAAWHADVEVFDVFEDGQAVGRFFLDMHPRPDKYKHAAMFDMAAGMTGRRLPQACLVCNFPAPSKDDHGLMEPDQVKTFFHEFGHLMHHILAGRQHYMAVSGIATEWDFVEVPSQLFEEWGRDAEVLATFAVHDTSGEPIPAELVRRMNQAGDYGKGMATRTQMFYASLSLNYYNRDPSGVDTTALMKELRSRFVPFPFEEGTAFQASFGHLDGYSALYYCYMWSLVLAKDVFSSFEGDIMDPTVARRYRDCVLAPGGSKDAAELVSDFLGRPFAFDAFEAWLAD
jgi:thimet oligopeptidase